MRSPLQKLGLTQYEEKVYITLLQYGNLHAKEISTYSSVPKTAVYPTLKQLEEKRLITSFKGDTTQFEAIDPNISLLSLEEQKKQEIKDNTNLALSLAKEKYQKKKIVKKKEVVSLSVGKASSSAIYKEMLKNAQSTVYIIGWRAHTVGNKF